MRLVLALLIGLVAAAALPADAARADPYRWCAEYGGRQGGSTNCYFMTIEQCRASISGHSGFCRPNFFYDGRPVVTPEDRAPPRRRHG